MKKWKKKLGFGLPYSTVPWPWPGPGPANLWVVPNWKLRLQYFTVQNTLVGVEAKFHEPSRCWPKGDFYSWEVLYCIVLYHSNVMGLYHKFVNPMLIRLSLGYF